MLISTGLLIATGSALCARATAKIFKKREKKKKCSHILGTEKQLKPLALTAGIKTISDAVEQRMPAIIDLEVVSPLRELKRRKMPSLLQSSARYPSAKDTVSLSQTVSQALKHPVLAPFFDDARQQHLEAISTTEQESEISNAEKEANRNLSVSLATVGMVTAGHLIYPPLVLASFPGIGYLCFGYMKNAYKGLFHERRFTISIVDSIYCIGGSLLGYHFWIALSCAIECLSEKLLARTEDQSRRSLMNVFGEQPRSVWIQRDNYEIEMPFEQLQIDDIIVVGAGQMIPVDGTIVDGIGSIDQHRLTGESQPREFGSGAGVLASTIVLSGEIRIRVEKTGEETTAAQIGGILKETANFRLSTQLRGRAMTDKSTLPTLALGSVALPLFGPSSALALLGNYPGENLRLLAPMSILNFLHLASKRGILIKDGRSLERLEEVDTFVFDKTGTLTLEQPHVGAIHACGNFSKETVLTYAATAEQRQTHPIARAILATAREQGNEYVEEIRDAHYEVGYGIKVSIGNAAIRVGSDRFMTMENIDIPPAIGQVQTRCHAEGHSLVMVAVDDRFAGAIELHATIRPEAKTIIDGLKQRGNSLYIISGDQEQPTRRLADELGIDNYFAQTLPENKAQLIEKLQAEGRSVCFVGDGINDSIALDRADVSISLRGASTIATDTAQIVLMDASLNSLVDLVEIARDLNTNTKVNFTTSVIPCVVGIGGVFLFHFGFMSSLVLYGLGLFAGIGNTLLPMFKEHGWQGEKINK